MFRFLVWVSVVLSGVPGRLFADSDGYYCVGPNYFAYQFSFSDSVPGHNLFITMLSDDDSPFTAMRVELPDFQVHGMMCGDGDVQVLGWRTLYRVDVDESDARLVETAPLAAPGSTPAGFEHQEANLAAFRESVARQPLGAAGTRFSYELRFGDAPLKDYEVQGTTDLVRVDEAGNVQESVRLYQGWIRQ